MTVSIYIPVFNGAKYISETLDAVLAQDYYPIDAVVVDNCSTDETAAIVRKYESRGIKYSCNRENFGALGNHNICISLAVQRDEIKYVKILSADDVMMPKMIGEQVRALEQHPGAVVAGSDCVVTDEHLTPRYVQRYLHGLVSGTDAIRSCAETIQNKIGGPSNLLLRRTAILGDRYKLHLRWLGELEFVCRILQRGDYINNGQPGFFYRRHGLSDSEQSCPLRTRMGDEYVFTRKYGGIFSYARLAYRYRRNLFEFLACIRSTSLRENKL